MTDVFPTSYAQERLWTVAQLAPDDAAYNVPIALRLDGTLDADALCEAIEQLVHRHSVLRTSFTAKAGRPVQLVHASAPFAVQRTDLNDQDLDEIVSADAVAPFDLATPPLMRARLIRVNPDSHVLSLCLHHIVVDEWSVNLLLDEMTEHYTASVRGTKFTRPQSSTVYGKYAQMQRAGLSAQREAELREHWTRQLAGAPDVILLPADRPRPAVPTFHGAHVRDRIPAETRDALNDVAGDEHATLFMVLLAGLAAVLSRTSGQSDVVIGTSVADRGEAEFDDVVGFFVNTLVLRTSLAGRPSFRELLRQVWETCVEAYGNQDLPFEKLVEILQPPRTAASHPVFQVMLTLHHSGDIAPRLPGLVVSQLPFPSTGDIPFDLSLSVLDLPDGLELVLRYSTDLFDPPTAARVLEQLRLLLTAAAKQPDKPVGLLPLMADPERRKLCGGEKPGPLTDTVPARIAAQAERTPTAIAVTAGDARLTYAELDTWANGLTHRLRGLSVGAETMVGIATQRGTGFIAAIQGVWRAGGAFVPLDPNQPADRVASVVRQARCRVVLVDETGHAAVAEALADMPAADRPVLVDVTDTTDHGPAASEWLAKPNGLAYVIFTSGTTGAPKGAMVTHDGMLNHLAAKITDTGMTASDVLAQNGPATFDVVVWQCCAPLVLGGKVHVVPDAAAGDPDALATELARGEVTVLQAVPSAISLLLTLSAPDARLSTLRWMVSTGDALTTELAGRWTLAYPDILLLNTYGVTECSDDQYHGVVGSESGPIAALGEPLAGNRGYVLDPELEPVPEGVVGELFLGGVGVGRGYAARPGLTADRFVPDPYGPPGARMYRTGDLTRRAAGRVEFLGRSDFQLKVRGFRVEAGEVEAALCRHPAVREAVVVGHGPAGPQRLLIGYIVAEQAAVPTAEVSRFVAGVLPDYMVPHHLMWLTSLPVTRHGKLDRDALPPPDAENTTIEQVRAGDSITEMVTDVWREVLGRDQIGTEEGFFHQGGTSLLAVDLIGRLDAASGIRITLAELLTDPTVGGVAETIRAALRHGIQRDPIGRADRDSALPASFAQERLWVIEQVTECAALYVVPFAIRAPVALDDAALSAVIDRLLARHEVLRTGFDDPDGRPIQVLHPSVPAPLTVDDLTGMPEADRHAKAEELLTADAQAGFDLRTPPLLRVRAMRMRQDEIVLGIVLHHAVTDAWSNDILVRDLLELLEAASAGRDPRLPDIPITYADFAAWQRQQLVADSVDHWVETLSGHPELSTMPGDRPRPAVASHRGGIERIRIPADVTGAAQAFGRAEGGTDFMVLLSSLYVLLSRFSGQRDVVIGAPVAGRDQPETHEVVGCFLNTLALRLDPAGRPGFREVLRHTREVCLDAYAHVDVPFETLVERLRPHRNVAHHPVFQVMLSVLPDQAQRPALAANLPVATTATAKFDLTFQVARTAEGWEMTVEYATDLYDARTVQRFGRALGLLLRAGVAEPDRPIAVLPLTAEQDIREIETWRTGSHRVWQPVTLPELVAEQVVRTPDAPAVGELSYREFWDRVTALAMRLRERGAGPDRLVGVCLERSAELVITVHAIVAAGAAYLPLEPGHPVARTEQLVSGTGVDLVVCGPDQLDRFARCAVTLVDPAETAAGPALPLPPVDSLAYVIHTSGSTGRPKAVQISHRAVVNRLKWMQEVLPIGPGHRVLHKTPFGFDVSVWELFWPLTVGATVLPAEPEAHRDPHRLYELIGEGRVDTVHFVPSMLGPFLDVAEHRPMALRRVICSGEALPPALAERFLDCMPGVELHNLYGPTEAAVDVTWQPITAAASVVPIGRPVANTEVEILDAEGQRTPVGVWGELYLGGVQLARGYGGQPGLTAQRFVPAQDGRRLYRTGDIARWCPDGTIELSGRADEQVKIRGHRVEPAEVEAELSRHPEVRAAAVLARSGRLVAYVVPVGNELPDLKAYLSAGLPEYLVPSLFVTIPALPLTPNGKLDRAALPRPQLEPDTARYVEPEDGAQRELAEIWARVLGVDRVGAQDNFFELGGDSIMSLLVVSQAARAGLRIRARQFFEHQTIADMAATARQPVQRAAGKAAHRVDAVSFGRVVAMLRSADEPTGSSE